MTTRAAAVLVVLEEPIREDDLEPLLNAIRMMRGVVAVRVVENDPSTEYVTQVRTTIKIAGELHEFARDLMKKT